MYVVALSGVDGSGKSTLADALVREALLKNPDVAIARLWLRYSPKIGATSTPKSTVSSVHRGHVLKRFLVSTGVPGPWVRANAAIYRRQLRWQLSSAQHLDIVVADRFVLDFLVDLAAAGAMTPSRARGVMDQLPNANLSFNVIADPNTLTARLKPGDDGTRVLSQAELYQSYAKDLGIASIDGRDVSHVQRIVATILGEAAR